MHAQQRGARDARRLLARQQLKRFLFERALDDANPIGTFRMAWPHFMAVARGMGQKQALSRRTGPAFFGRVIAAQASPQRALKSTNYRRINRKAAR